MTLPLANHADDDASYTLAELLATRLCHDITGPIGAIYNGTELLAEEEEDMREPALALITDSAAEAIARITFYRFAYGTTKNDSMMAQDSLRSMTERFLAPASIGTEWHLDAAELPQPDGRLLSNLILIGAGALLRGGTLLIHSSKDRLDVQATGTTVALNEACPSTLEAGQLATAPELTPRSVQYYLTGQLAASLGYHLHVTANDTACHLVATR